METSDWKHEHTRTTSVYDNMQSVEFPNLTIRSFIDTCTSSTSILGFRFILKVNNYNTPSSFGVKLNASLRSADCRSGFNLWGNTKVDWNKRLETVRISGCRKKAWSDEVYHQGETHEHENCCVIRIRPSTSGSWHDQGMQLGQHFSSLGHTWIA